MCICEVRTILTCTGGDGGGLTFLDPSASPLSQVLNKRLVLLQGGWKVVSALHHGLFQPPILLQPLQN